VPVDLIPFGPIASADGKVAWPPSRDVVLYVAGFEDALQSSVRIEIYGDLIVAVTHDRCVVSEKLPAARI
jgi:predicted nucleotidyltransferase